MLIVPDLLLSLDHEVELAVIISQKPHNVPQSTTVDYVAGYALGLDMNAREIQASAKFNYLPWSRAVSLALGGRSKLGFINGSIKISDASSPNYESWLSKDQLPISIKFWKRVNGRTRVMYPSPSLLSLPSSPLIRPFSSFSLIDTFYNVNYNNF
ncbi:acylpyruvase FAHD1 [Pyrus ussuriensis x Pyrus communis]|uniref:Acylpyruvase FAHD1 n=1 Tax=Pyrus ussuriensis x Pyrus communis TaxID=2448454 RepID=A0A5N5FD91_9ROSA|nr:acylpyruvase FAHD1 [Pyrus ussuriensis x Pyrus communis]